MNALDESTVENAALEWLSSLGCRIIFTGEISHQE